MHTVKYEKVNVCVFFMRVTEKRYKNFPDQTVNGWVEFIIFKQQQK